MTHILPALIFTTYCVSTYILGRAVVRKWTMPAPIGLTIVASFLIGTAIGVSFTYLLACVFLWTRDPMFWGTVFSIPPALGIAYVLATHTQGKQRRYADRSSVCLILLATLFAAWLMNKTFHGGAGGTLFVGSNNVFDFGHDLGIIRSFSWGANIPFTSPFESGLPFFYHFLFYFWVAMWEHFGVPIVWALNIPSVVSYISLITVVYYLPQLLWKQGRLVGWVAVLFTVTNSSLTFWYVLVKHGLSLALFRTVWQLPTYPFAGPFDGSTISLYLTQNTYVNQRHLAFSIAMGLLLILFVDREADKNSDRVGATVVSAGMCGVLFLWNMPISLLVAFVIMMILTFRKFWKRLCIFGSLFGAVLLISSVHLLPMAGAISYFVRTQIFRNSTVQTVPSWSPVTYLWQNLGVLPIAILIGFVALRKRRHVALTFILLFAAQCLAAVIGHRGFDQKFFSFLVIGVNLLAATGLVWLWNRRGIVSKASAILFCAILSISGFIDLMPVKNEFAYPLVGPDTAPVINWIARSTPAHSVFISYSDIIDPVVLAGRKNFYGFFGNIGWYDRTPDMKKIYQGDAQLAKAKSISYILIPKFQKNNFPYAVNEEKLHQSFTVVYEDPRYKIYALDR